MANNKISVVIITRNEEEDITSCLESVKWADEIVVVDSSSRDKTVEICRGYGCKIIEMDNEEGYAGKKNRGINTASGDWILSLDADEQISSELAEEIKEIVRADKCEDGYLIPMKFYFFGHWMRRGGLYPKPHLRLFRRGKGEFEERAVHEGVKVEGAVGNLRQPMLHYSYKNLEDYLHKFNRYSTLDALDKSRGRKWGRWYPFLRLHTEFITVYFIRQGFRDGFYGLLYSVLQSFYVFVKYMKLWESQYGKTDNGR